MTWTLAAFDTRCGACGGWIIQGQPLALLTVTKKRRCRKCIEPLFGDQSVHVAALYAEKSAQDAATTQGREILPTLANSRPTYGQRAPAPAGLTKASDVGRTVFDPKRAAAGDSE